MMIEKKIVALVFLMLISTSAISQGSIEKYYRSCDGLNNPLLVHFSKPILKNQKENLPGRYFKVTYDLNRRTRVYRLDKIEHYFLDQPQPVYDYKKGVDAKINYAQFQKVLFTYDEYDNIEKIEYRDKNGAPAENSNGISKFEYQKRSNRSFNYLQKTFYLDTDKKHKIRNATFDNNGDLSLYFVSKNINDERIRVLSKYRSNSSGISKKLDYKGSEKHISTSYYHPNTNQRTYNAIDGTYLLVEKYNNEGFLLSRKSEDRIGMPVGLNLSYALEKEGSKKVYRLIEGENGLNFSKGTDFKLKEYNADYDLTHKELCNGDMVDYIIKSVSQGVLINSSRSGSEKISRIVIKNNKGLLLSRVTEQDGDKTRFEITYHLDFLSNGGVKGENLKYTNTRKNNQINVCSKMPMIKKYYYENGYLKKEERYNSDNKILGSEIINTSKAYPYDCVPVINYDYYPNGDLHFKYVQDAKEEYFNPEKISSYFIDSDFFKDWAKESYGFINFIAYRNKPNKSFSETAYYNRLGTVDLNNVVNPQSYIFKVTDTYYPSKGKSLTTATSENTKQHAIDNNQNKNIHTIEKIYDKFNRLESLTTSYLDGNIENTKYTYSNEYLPKENYSGVKHYMKEGDIGTNKPWMKNGYHTKEVVRDKRGNETSSIKRDENGDIINSIRDAAFVKNRYNGDNRVEEMIFKDSLNNNKKINLWKYSDQAIYKIKRQIDSRGNETKLTVYTETQVNDEKRDIKLDEIIKKYDQRDNIIFEYKTLSGKPVPNEDGTYIQKMDYDEKNNLRIIMNYDAKEKPMADSEGYYGYRYTYNEDRLEISKRFLSRDYNFDDVVTNGDIMENDDGNAKKHGTNIHMETYEYDDKFNKNVIRYFKDKEGEMPASDRKVHCVKTHFDMSTYETDTIEYFGEDMKPENHHNGFAKQVFIFDDNGRKIMTKHYKEVNNILVLRYKNKCGEGQCEYYERVSIDDKSKKVTYYKEGKEGEELPEKDEFGLHEIVVLYEGANNSQIKSITFWGLRKGKKIKINVSNFARLVNLLQLDKNVAEHITEVHEVDLTYINNRIYINCFNAKGKPSQFTLNGRSYEFLELSSGGRPISLMEGIPHKL